MFYKVAVNMVVVLAMIVAEATTRAVAMARDTKHCPAVAEATIPIPATLLAAAESSATSTNSKTEDPAAMSIKATVLSCHKTSKSKSQQ
jgi:hypothetical protein